MQAGLSPEGFAAAPASGNPADGIPGATSGTRSTAAPGVFDGVKSLGASLGGLVHDHMRIIALETRQAGESLVNMIAASVVLAVLVVSAWLILVATGVIVLIGSGFGVIFAMLLAAALNLVMAWFLYRSIREMSQRLGFPATIRSLGGGSGHTPHEHLAKERA